MQITITIDIPELDKLMPVDKELSAINTELNAMLNAEHNVNILDLLPLMDKARNTAAAITGQPDYAKQLDSVAKVHFDTLMINFYAQLTGRYRTIGKVLKKPYVGSYSKAHEHVLDRMKTDGYNTDAINNRIKEAVQTAFNELIEGVHDASTGQ